MIFERSQATRCTFFLVHRRNVMFTGTLREKGFRGKNQSYFALTSIYLRACHRCYLTTKGYADMRGILSSTLVECAACRSPISVILFSPLSFFLVSRRYANDNRHVFTYAFHKIYAFTRFVF